MTTRVQEAACLPKETIIRKPRMGSLEKTMLCQSGLEPGAMVLDANVCNGKLADYLLHSGDCRVCGISDRLEEVRQVRSRMNGGDIAYAAIGDIPWQDSTFDTVLLHPAEGGAEELALQLKECSRVMKPGSRLVLGLRRSLLNRLSSFLADGAARDASLPTAKEAQLLMERSGFVLCNTVQASLDGQVLVGILTKEE